MWSTISGLFWSSDGTTPNEPREPQPPTEPSANPVPQLPSLTQVSQTANEPNFSPLPNDQQFETAQQIQLNSLIHKYGMDSPYVKEFVLATTDVSSQDETKMLSPCGVHFTNTIFYSTLLSRFGKDTILLSREAGREYEKCLVKNTAEELLFWTKIREQSQIHLGFVQAKVDSYHRERGKERMVEKYDELLGVHDETEKLRELTRSSPVKNKKQEAGQSLLPYRQR